MCPGPIPAHDVSMTLAASQGKVYWMAVTTAAGEGEGDALAKKIADSFRVK